MALTGPTKIRSSSNGIAPSPHEVMPVSVVSDWTTINTDLKTADNAAATVVAPGAITRTAITVLDIGSLGTTVLLRMKYKTATSVTTSPVVQIFGFDTGNTNTFAGTVNEPEKLLDTDGNHELTLASAASDVTAVIDSVTWGFSATQKVDANACRYIMGAVKTAGVQTTHTPVLEVKVY